MEATHYTPSRRSLAKSRLHDGRLDESADCRACRTRPLPSNLAATAIARELCVSPNTVRTHLRHICAKLDAHGRTDAVTHGRQIGLLASAPRPL